MIASPFRHLLIAVALSPRAKANLAEAFRISAYFGARLTILHVGALSVPDRQRLLALINEVKEESVTHHLEEREGKPVKEILRACAEFKIDLLLAGALVKEGIWTYYVGSVARKLCRKANCSILLLTDPRVEQVQISKIAVNGANHPKTPTTLGVALRLTTLLRAGELVVVQEIPSKRVAKAEDDRSLHKSSSQFQQICQEEETRINGIMDQFPGEWREGVRLSTRCLMGEPGYTIGHYSALQKVDLLVMNSPDTRLRWLDRVFTHDLEYLLNELPCDLLLVHSTKKQSL